MKSSKSATTASVRRTTIRSRHLLITHRARSPVLLNSTGAFLASGSLSIDFDTVCCRAISDDEQEEDSDGGEGKFGTGAERNVSSSQEAGRLPLAGVTRRCVKPKCVVRMSTTVRFPDDGPVVIKKSVVVSLTGQRSVFIFIQVLPPVIPMSIVGSREREMTIWGARSINRKTYAAM